MPFCIAFNQPDAQGRILRCSRGSEKDSGFINQRTGRCDQHTQRYDKEKSISILQLILNAVKQNDFIEVKRIVEDNEDFIQLVQNESDDVAQLNEEEVKSESEYVASEEENESSDDDNEVMNTTKVKSERVVTLDSDLDLTIVNKEEEEEDEEEIKVNRKRKRFNHESDSEESTSEVPILKRARISIFSNIDD